MQNKAVITTIIPTYNRASRLKKAIESVLSQTYPYFELHIYDNASEDNTQKIVEEYARKDSRIIYHRHAENIGATKNFAFGLSRVTTSYFSFLSDDDLLLPNFYEDAIQGLQKYPEAGFFCGGVIICNENGKIIHVGTQAWRDQKYYSPPEGLFEMIGKHLEWIGCLFRTEVRDRIGNIDTELKPIDVDYMYRASALFPFVISKKPCGIFIQHSTSLSFCSGLLLIWPSWLKIIENINKQSSLLPEIQDRLNLFLKRDLYSKLLFAYIQSLRQKNYQDCKKTVEVLRSNYSQKNLAFLLTLIVNFMQFIPLLHALFIVSLALRRKIIKKNRNMHTLFRPYVLASKNFPITQ